MKKLLTPLLAVLLVGCQQASTAETSSVDVTEDNTTATPIEVVPAPEPQVKWTCPSCTENEKHVLRELQVTAKITPTVVSKTGASATASRTAVMNHTRMGHPRCHNERHFGNTGVTKAASTSMPAGGGAVVTWPHVGWWTTIGTVER